MSVSGIVINGSPIKKSHGERDRKSFGSVDNAVRRLELSITSIRLNKVDNSLNVKTWTLKEYVEVLHEDKLNDKMSYY